MFSKAKKSTNAGTSGSQKKTTKKQRKAQNMEPQRMEMEDKQLDEKNKEVNPDTTKGSKVPPTLAESLKQNNRKEQDRKALASKVSQERFEGATEKRLKEEATKRELQGCSCKQVKKSKRKTWIKFVPNAEPVHIEKAEIQSPIPYKNVWRNNRLLYSDVVSGRPSAIKVFVKQSPSLVSTPSTPMLLPSSESAVKTRTNIAVGNIDVTGLKDECTVESTHELRTILDSFTGDKIAHKITKTAKNSTSIEPLIRRKNKWKKVTNEGNRMSKELNDLTPKLSIAKWVPNEVTMLRPKVSVGNRTHNQLASLTSKLSVVSEDVPLVSDQPPTSRAGPSTEFKTPTPIVASENVSALEILDASQGKYTRQAINSIPIADLPNDLPFGMVVHAWNFYDLDNDLGLFPKFSYQFNDDNYLQAEKKAMVALDLGMRKKQDVGKPANTA